MIRHRTRTSSIATATVASAILATTPLASAANPAFPGATGPGAVATGGRGGDVYHVTRLDADLGGSIPGTLSYGIRNAPSAGRTIVFDVGGTIYHPGGTQNNDTLGFSRSNITIAGQTAPGPGITIAGTGTKWSGSNVILRNIAVRPNKSAKPDSVTFDAFSLQLQGSIVDHVSATWFTDEGISITDAGRNTTVQYAIIADGLNYGGHAFGSIISTEHPTAEYSFNHNLYGQLRTRIPAVGSEYHNDMHPVATTEWSNNVINNWDQTKAGYGSGDGASSDPNDRQYSKNNFIGNYYINNKNPKFTTNLFRADATHQMYNTGNYFGVASPEGTITDAFAISTNNRSYFGDVTFVASPFAITGVSDAVRDTAVVALQRVRDYSGMNWQNRSQIDQTVINKIGDSDFNSINDLSGSTQSAQWNTLMAQRPNAQGAAPFTRPANFDTDRDGMPDLWESAHGTNPAIANNNADFDNDGYTDLEKYINELGAWPAPATLTFTNANANGRYAQVGNWGNVWQPTRYDAVQINVTTAKIDAPGQHARNLTIAATSGSTAGLQVTSGWIDIRENLAVGTGGNGSVNQSGGIVRAGTAVTIGSAMRAGTYNLSGGTLATPLLTKGNAASTFNFTGGVLHADHVNFSLANNGGTLAPGSDAALQLLAAASMADIHGNTVEVLPFVGSTHISGDLTLVSGLLEIDLASTAGFDTIFVDGVLTLGGGLAVVLNNGYEPAPDARWLIGSADEITGQFALITDGVSTQIDGGNLYLTTAVPEPTVIGLGAAASLFMLQRSRRPAGPTPRHVSH